MKDEDMSDYTVTVTAAEILSYSEYLDKYSYSENSDNPLFLPTDTVYPEMVYDVTIIIRNINLEENPNSYMNLRTYKLYANDFCLDINETLYEMSNPELSEPGHMAFMLRPGTEMELHLPFYFQPSSNMTPITIEDVKGTDIYLILSLYPEQKEVKITETNR